MNDGDRLLAFPGPDGVQEALVNGVEALLFAHGEPLTAAAAADALQVPVADVRQAIALLASRRSGAGVIVEAIAGGWQLRTAPDLAGAVHRLLGTKPQRLSRAALEALAIVAWRQPVARSEVERLRGVDSGGVLKSLLDKGLLRAAGRSDEPGRPLQYCTTDGFLELFGMADLAALPTLAERDALARAQPPEEGDLPPEPEGALDDALARAQPPAEEGDLPPEPEGASDETAVEGDETA